MHSASQFPSTPILSCVGIPCFCKQFNMRFSGARRVWIFDFCERFDAPGLVGRLCKSSVALVSGARVWPLLAGVHFPEFCPPFGVQSSGVVIESAVRPGVIKHMLQRGLCAKRLLKALALGACLQAASTCLQPASSMPPFWPRRWCKSLCERPPACLQPASSLAKKV